MDRQFSYDILKKSVIM